MKQKHDESRHVWRETGAYIICERTQVLRNRKGHQLEYNMTGAAIIQHRHIRRRRIIRYSGLSGGGPDLPLTQTRETCELDSKDENKPDKKQMPGSRR